MDVTFSLSRSERKEAQISDKKLRRGLSVRIDEIRLGINIH